MKQKIGFFISSLGIGGIEKALLNMIKIMDKNKYDITIYTIEKKGCLIEEFEKIVQIKEIPKLKEKLLWNGKQILQNQIKDKKYMDYLKTLFKIMYCKIIHKDRNELAIHADDLSENLDIAVAYQVPISPITIFVAEKVKANKKYLWNHADILSVPFKQIKKYDKYLKQYDKIFSVSQKGTEDTKKLLPQYKDKLETFYNVMIKEEIIKKAEEHFENCFSKENINIVTVGRLAKGKGYELAIQITAELVKEHYPIKWFAVGDGEEKESLKHLIKEEKIENSFILLGEKKNPYPYIKNADIFVQPSKNEGNSVTATEAKILHKPIITTNTKGVEEKFKNGETAIIVNYGKQEIKEAIKDLVNQREKRVKLEQNLLEANKKAENYQKILKNIFNDKINEGGTK